MSSKLRTRDIQLLRDARDEIHDDLDRNAVIEAFKRAGAQIVRGDIGELRIQFQGKLPYDLPLGRGRVDLRGRHATFLLTLRDMATDILQQNNLD